MLVHTPRSVKLASTLGASLDALGYDHRSFAMTGDNLQAVDSSIHGPNRPPAVAILLIGTGTETTAAEDYADRAVALAKRGSLVLVLLLNRTDPNEPARSIETRAVFQSLAEHWISAPDADGWEDRLVVVNVGGKVDALRAVARRVPSCSPHGSDLTWGDGEQLRLAKLLLSDDRLGIAARFATEAERAKFSVERMYLKVEDQKAIGVVSGSFSRDVTVSQAQSFAERLDRVFPLQPSLPHVGLTPARSELFEAGRYASKRRIFLPKVANVSGKLATLLRTLSGPHGGANVVSIACETHTSGSVSLQNISIVAEVGFLPPEERVVLYQRLRDLKGFPCGIQITGFRGAIADIERGTLH